METTRRQYLIGAAGAITVTPTGEVLASSKREGDEPPEVPPQKRADHVFELQADPISSVGIGIIGLGNRGPGMTSLLADINENSEPDCEIKAVCDVVQDRVEDMVSKLQEDFDMDPATYSAGVAEDEWKENKSFREDDLDKMVKTGWKNLAQREDIDLVFVFTHHRAHAPMCEYILEQGKHVACEVPIATTIEECWDLVLAAERNRKHCMQLENYSYGEEEMWLTNMVQNEIFGDITYSKTGYVHNLVGTYFMLEYGPPINWRSRQHFEVPGDTYPTHGLGPTSWYLELLRGDRMEYLVAQESPEAGLTEYAQNELEPEDEFYNETDWANGDTTRSLIKTHEGIHIENQLDVKTKRHVDGLSPNTLAGDGAYHESSTRHGSDLWLGNQGHEVADKETYYEYWDDYRHPVWEKLGEKAEGSGHGGGDFIELYRFIDALNSGRPVDYNVYDSVSIAAVRPLSRISIENGNRPVKFPEFTQGEWKKDRELPINLYY